MEVVYSFVRKLHQKKSPFNPDREHLHLKIFDILNTSTNKPFLSNNLTTIFLAIFWLFPPFILPLVYDNQLWIIISLVLLSFFYITIAIIVPPKWQYSRD
jgi:hypothetical protein